MRLVVAASLLLSLLFFSLLSWAQASSAQAQPVVDSSDASITVTVLDRGGHPVSGLSAGQFRVLEDGNPRTITSVSTQDSPLCIGFVVDKSGSMRGKLGPIASALRTFLEASNPQNRSFVVTFNDDRVLEQDFTTNSDLIEKAVAMANPRGGTGLYDAITASADYLAKDSGCNRRALVVVSDGEDNESRHTLQYTIAALQQDGNPLIYTLGLPAAASTPAPRGRRALRMLAESTGGVEFFAENIDDLRKIAPRLADAIKNQYVIRFAGSSNTAGKEKVKVELTERHKDWLVRTNLARRSGVVPVSQPLAH